MKQKTALVLVCYTFLSRLLPATSAEEAVEHRYANERLEEISREVSPYQDIAGLGYSSINDLREAVANYFNHTDHSSPDVSCQNPRLPLSCDECSKLRVLIDYHYLRFLEEYPLSDAQYEEFSRQTTQKKEGQSRKRTMEEVQAFIKSISFDDTTQYLGKLFHFISKKRIRMISSSPAGCLSPQDREDQSFYLPIKFLRILFSRQPSLEVHTMKALDEAERRDLERSLGLLEL